MVILDHQFAVFVPDVEPALFKLLAILIAQDGEQQLVVQLGFQWMPIDIKEVCIS